MRKKSILLVAVFVLVSSFNFGCSSKDSREPRTSDYISEHETYHQYSFNEYSSLVKVQFDSINPRAVTLSDGILIRQCILVDVIVEQDYFEHVQKNAHITIPIFTTYYPSGETNNPIELIDDVSLLINKMDDSYFYFETLIIDNRYRNTYKFDDGTFYEPVLICRTIHSIYIFMKTLFILLTIICQKVQLRNCFMSIILGRKT